MKHHFRGFRILLFAWIVICARTSGLFAATLSVTPAAISNLYNGPVTFQITGLTNGEPVILEKFVDFNNNGVYDGGELLVQSFNLTEGQIPVVAGITNVNVPGDLDGSNTSITAKLLAHGGPNQGVGNYLFRLSSPSARFAPVTSVFAVTNSGYAQSISGSVVNGTNVPNAFVLLLTSGGEFISGSMADAAGNYQIKTVPGTYQLIALRPGFIGDFSTAPLVVLASGATVVTNVPVTAASLTIGARLIDAGTSNGIAGVFFFVQSSAGQATIAYTDASGNVTIPVSSGRWQLRTETDGVTPLGYLALSGKLNVDTTTGSVSGITFAVPKASALFYGTLKNSGNAAVPGIEITGNTQDNVYKSSGVTDTNGYYVMAASGTNWSFGPSSDSLAPFGYSSAGTNLSLSTGQASRVDFVVQSVTASFNGRVVDESGNPISNMGISANDNGSKNASGQTDINGNFTVGVSGGTWTLQLSSGDAAQRNLVSPSVTLNIVDGQNISNIVLVARAGTFSITGSVRDGTNGVVANIGVTATSTINNTNYNTYASTDAGGNYSALVVNGNWNLNVDCYNLGQRNLSCPGSQSAIIAGSGATVNFVVYGPPVGNLIFRFFTTVADFGSDYAPALSFPKSLKLYQAVYTVTDPAPPASITFTGPGPSGLSNTVSASAVLNPGAPSFYFSPQENMSSNVPTSGTWSMQFKGTPQVFSNFPDPQYSSRFVIPRPTVNVTGDILKSVSWSYYNSSGGTFGGIPPFISSNLVEVFDDNQNFIYQSPFLAGNATSFTFDQILNWSQISRIRMRYLDSMTNYYFVSFTKNQPNIVSTTRTGNQIQFNVNAPVNGGNYYIQYTTNLSQTNWSSLLVTNISSSPITFVDPSPTDKARFYRILFGP